MNDSVISFPETGTELASTPALGPEDADARQSQRLAALEAIIFAAGEPPTIDSLSNALGLPEESVQRDLEILCETYRSEERGVEIRPIAGGYRMLTKPVHHDAVRAFAKSLTPKLRLSAAALETLAIVAYRQPVTIPEIGAIRGVSSAAGPIHTLLRHKLIMTAGRKKVIGRPMRYKTTDDFLVHFGLNDLSELPTVSEMSNLADEAPHLAPSSELPFGRDDDEGGRSATPGPDQGETPSS